jgi:hypothetical protein
MIMSAIASPSITESVARISRTLFLLSPCARFLRPLLREEGLDVASMEGPRTRRR